MEIKKGIMFLSEATDGYNNISINTGVLPYNQIKIPRVKHGKYSFVPSFEEDAFLPQKTWRSLTQKELTALRASDKRTDTNTIYTGDLPDKLKNWLVKLNIGECTTRDEVFEKFKSEPAITKKVNKAMEEFLISKANGKPHRIHYLGTNLPNLEAVACDTTIMPKGYKEQDKKYMGIHNDGTYYIPFRNIHTSGNRLTINLGNESRYFLFVNLTLSQVYNMLKQKVDITKRKIDVINISKYFFNLFPDYPVLRVEQKPFQYYIAPTDNCFHDGCTLGKKETDIVLVYFGAFQF